MGRKVSNVELVKVCYMRTHEAADQVSGLQNGLPDLATLPPEVAYRKLKQLRDTLREAFCAAQELKNRAKEVQSSKFTVQG